MCSCSMCTLCLSENNNNNNMKPHATIFLNQILLWNGGWCTSTMQAAARLANGKWGGASPGASPGSSSSGTTHLYPLAGARRRRVKKASVWQVIGPGHSKLFFLLMPLPSQLGSYGFLQTTRAMGFWGLKILRVSPLGLSLAFQPRKEYTWALCFFGQDSLRL